MEKEDILALDTRRRIYREVRRRPGIHLRGLERGTGVPLSTLRYHLRFMEEQGLLSVRRESQYNRYYPREELGPRDRAILALLRRKKPRRILLTVLSHGGEAWYQELREDLDYPESTLGLYLKELVDGGVLERKPVGRTSKYRVVDEDRVVNLLVRYREGFLDRWVDNVLEIVLEEPAFLDEDDVEVDGAGPGEDGNA